MDQQDMFQSTNVSSLADAAIELSRCLLVSERLKKEAVNSVSTTEHENIKRELAESDKSLESVLETNVVFRCSLTL